MTQRRDRDQPAEVNPGIAKLEHYAAVSEANEIDLDRLVVEYQLLYPDKPVFHLAEDIQQQAAIYWNIIERLKLGNEAGAIRSTFEKLGLVPKDTLPNPANDRLLNFALGRISKFRLALLRLVRDYGGRFIQELRLEGSSAISVGAQLGLPPSISISVEYSLQAVAEDRWTTQRTSSDPRRSE